MSLTQQALAWMDETGATAYAAAKKFGVTPATIYQAAKKPKCPCCGAYLKEGANVRVLTEDKPDIDDLLKA